MSFVSQMAVKIRPGRRAEAIAAFKERRVLEECADAVPGFLKGRLLLSTDCPDAFVVEAEWTNLSDIADWQNHPVRSAQANDLSGWLAGEPETQVYESMD